MIVLDIVLDPCSVGGACQTEATSLERSRRLTTVTALSHGTRPGAVTALVPPYADLPHRLNSELSPLHALLIPASVGKFVHRVCPLPSRPRADPMAGVGRAMLPRDGLGGGDELSDWSPHYPPAPDPPLAVLGRSHVACSGLIWGPQRSGRSGPPQRSPGPGDPAQRSPALRSNRFELAISCDYQHKYFVAHKIHRNKTDGRDVEISAFCTRGGARWHERSSRAAPVSGSSRTPLPGW